ncbi:GntR family transcriptional regulator [Streptomyces sp. NPDC053474]|uniref:GntR family transcriptional regulator n=1 Tax=Streptomyces sp. NPDC053474 TaxID=3365704 RepID=UPI0037CD3A5F
MRSTPEQPPYQKIAAELRRSIRTGRYRPGDRLPSARELMEQHGIANGTAQNALNLLKQEGVAYSVHGRGSFVAQDLSRAEPPALPAEGHHPCSGELAALTAQVGALSAQVAELCALVTSLRAAERPRNGDLELSPRGAVEAPRLRYGGR